MNLAQSDERPLAFASGGTELRYQSRSVAFDCAARVLLGESEIEGVPAISAGESAESRAESMNQPRNASERFRTKDGQSRLVNTLLHQNILELIP